MTGGSRLRDRQLCPEWCEGNDHRQVAEEFGGEVEHHRMVGLHRYWTVTLLKPAHVPGHTRVVIDGTDADITLRYHAEMSTHEARSIAAWLVKAADLAETFS